MPGCSCRSPRACRARAVGPVSDLTITRLFRKGIVRNLF
jgi:hypothetical protein